MIYKTNLAVINVTFINTTCPYILETSVFWCDRKQSMSIMVAFDDKCITSFEQYPSRLLSIQEIDGRRVIYQIPPL